MERFTPPLARFGNDVIHPEREARRLDGKGGETRYVFG